MTMTRQQLVSELNTSNWVLIFLISLFCLTVVGFTIYTQDLNVQLLEARSELGYYQYHYQERVGYRTSQHGVRTFIRLLSIDGGQTWVEISDTREVMQPPYAHQRYPDLDPESLTEVK